MFYVTGVAAVYYCQVGPQPSIINLKEQLEALIVQLSHFSGQFGYIEFVPGTRCCDVLVI